MVEAGVAPKPTFVGRTTELLQLGAARDAAIVGSTTFVTVTGEAGVGKTRIMERVFAETETTAFWARCAGDRSDPPYWPLTQLLHGIREHHGVERYESVIDVDDSLLRVLDPSSVPWPRSNATSNDLDRFRLFDRIVTALQSLAEIEPLMLVVDDVHWADPSTLRLLRFLAQSLTSTKVGLFMTVRSGEVLTDERQTALDALAAETTSIRLNRFDRSVTADLLDILVVGDEAAASVEAAYAATGGNAFLITEYARLSGSGEPELWERYGPKLHSIALGAYNRLRPSTRETLQTAAVIGGRFDVDVLLDVAGGDPSGLLAGLDEAAEVGVIEPAGRNSFRFSHGLTREAIYEQIGSLLCQELHRAVALSLEEQHRQGVDVAGRVAHHWDRVGDEDSRARALVFTLDAAEGADARFARDDAVSGYRRALELLHSIGGNGEQEVDVSIRLAESLTALALADEARVILRSAADRAREIGDIDRFCKVALAFPPGLEGISIVPTADEEQVDLRTSALEMLPEGDSDLRALLLSGLAVSLYWTRHAAGRAHEFSESMVRQDQLSAEALAMARRLDDPTTSAACVLGRLHAVWGPDYLHERAPLTSELMNLARDLGDLDLLASTLAWLVLEALDVGDLDTAERHVAAYADIASRLGQPLYRRTARQWSASISVLRGEIDVGVDATFAALEETAGLIGDTYALADAILLQSVQLFLRGDLTAIVEPARMVVASDPRISINWQVGLLFCLAELGRLDEAQEMFDQLTADNLSRLPRDINWLVGAQLLGLTAVTLDEHEVGAQLYEALLPYEGRDTTHGWGYASYGPVSWVLGVLAVMLGRTGHGQKHFEEVLATRPPGPYRMVVELRLGELLLARDATDQRAIELLQGVVERGRTWSIEIYVTDAEALLEEIAPSTPASKPNTLTRTERGWLVHSDDLGEFELVSNRGAEYVVALMRNSGREIHALDLVARVESSGGAGRPRLTLDDDLKATFLELGEVIDDAARMSYEKRIGHLRAEMDRFESRGQSERAASARDEIESIEREVRRAMGLRGQVRIVAPEVERARVSVTKAIRRTLVKLDEQAPELAQHLRSSISTGTYCYYRDQRQERAWTVVSP